MIYNDIWKKYGFSIILIHIKTQYYFYWHGELSQNLYIVLQSIEEELACVLLS